MAYDTANHPPSVFCHLCDKALADDLAALPVEYQTRVLEAVRRLTETFARLSGTVLPREMPPNVVVLRRPQ